MSTSRKVFINLSVRDLQRSIDFFTGLGFSFNPQFTDHSATCMIVSEEAFVMLMVEPRFREFTKNDICDTKTHTETLIALSCESREEVDKLVDTALATGGRVAMPAQDHGFMYVRTFYCPDGHHWELAYMDMSAVPQQ